MTTLKKKGIKRMKNKMDSYLSQKIKYITAFALLLIVYGHSYNFTDSTLAPTIRITEGFFAPAMFQYLISNEITPVALQLFLMISGFLFFYTYENTRKVYLKKLTSRLRSLLVPYIIWATFSGLLLTVLSYFEFTSKLPLVEGMGHDWAHFLMYYYMPPAFQLWFLRRLVEFVIISPILYVLIKKTKGFFLILPALVWYFEFMVSGVVTFLYMFQGFFVFSLGGGIAILGKSHLCTRKATRKQTAVCVTFWLALCLLNTFIAALAEKGYAIDILMSLIGKSNIILGVISIWFLYDRIADKLVNSKLVNTIVSNSFFIYALHEPMQHLIYQSVLMMNDSTLVHMVLYIFLPIVIATICVCISMGLKKTCRKLYALLSGRR